MMVQRQKVQRLAYLIAAAHPRSSIKVRYVKLLVAAVAKQTELCTGVSPMSPLLFSNGMEEGAFTDKSLAKTTP